jgi:HAE1 family hydrophobic/amphiphilic exporter-1
VLLLLLLASMRDLRLAVIVVGSILLAVVISLSLFYFLHISVNFITISGLTVCFGMILDNSILVLDSVHRRLAEGIGGFRRGWRRLVHPGTVNQQIVAGTGEVAFPILATTLTTMVAFLSFVFLSGRLSLYYAPLAIAVATAMGASILVALGWMPVALRGAWIGRTSGPPRGAAPAAPAPGEHAPQSEAYVGQPPNGFEKMVRLTLRGWWFVLPLTLAILFSGWYLYKNKVDRGGFWQIPEKETLLMFISLPEGTDILMVYETMKRFERELLPVPEGVDLNIMVWRNNGRMQVRFDEEMLKSEYPLLYRNRLIELAEKMAGMGIFIRGFDEQAYVKGFFGGQRLNSTIRLTGYNSKALEDMAEGILRWVSRNRRVRHGRILNDMQYFSSPQDESVITIQRQRLVDYGLTVQEVVAYLRRLIGMDYPVGIIVDGEAERLQLRYDDAERIEFESVADQIIHTSGGKSVRLGDVLTLESLPLAGAIVREDQRYAKYVSWEYVGTESMRSRFLHSALGRLQLPYGYKAEEAEQSFLSEEEEGELTLMLILAVAFIYMILAGLFESLMLPLLVLLSVPMSLVGVFAIFWVSGSTFDSSARIGLILLFGIVVNNAILLVSRFRMEARDRFVANGSAGALAEIRGAFDLWRLPQALRAQTLQRAISHGTRVRLRSILLTTGTTIVGLGPLLIRFEKLEGKDIWENLALSSIGGLTASVILILLALPAAYYSGIRLAWWIGRRHRAA